MSFLRVLFLFIFFSVPISVLSKNVPIIHQGKLDLQQWDFYTDGKIQLKGNWEFYPAQLLTPDEIPFTNSNKTKYLEVPGNWNEYFPKPYFSAGNGYGTYRLLVDLGTDRKHLGICLNNIASATKIYVNGKLIGSNGIVSNSAESYIYDRGGGMYPVTSKNGKLEFVIQVANFDFFNGGMWHAINLGVPNILSQKHHFSELLHTVIFGALLIIALYHFGLFRGRTDDISLLYFACFCLIIAIRIFAQDVGLFHKSFSLSSHIQIRINHITFFLGVPLFMLFVSSIYTVNRWFCYALYTIGILFSLTSIFLPIFVSSWAVHQYHFVTFICCGYFFYIFIKGFIDKKEGAVPFLLSWLLLCFCVINDILYVRMIIETGHTLPYGIFIFMLTQAYILSSRFFQLFKQNQLLAFQLNEVNHSLEEKVKDRTNSLKKINDQLTENHRMMKESLEYASRIQHAMLPEKDILEDDRYEFFTFYKPKDIISGDFYWFNKTDNKLIAIAADCTGHGIPGAFMSVLGVSALNELRYQLSIILSPNKLLNELRERIKSSLKQTQTSTLNWDGMDMSCCVIDLESLEMTFAGAFHSAYIIRNNKITQLRGDRMPVGVHIVESPFTKQKLQLEKGDMIYLFSDGYSDQTGGRLGKKFMKKQFRGLLQSISNSPLNIQEHYLKQRLENWQGQHAQVDDILVVGVRIN